jgi:hypothetical protein
MCEVKPTGILVDWNFILGDVLVSERVSLTVNSTLSLLFQSDDGFPEACSDLGMKHMECLINKREQAMQVAIQLAGKEKCDTVFPYYEDNKKKAMELLQIYKENSSSEKKGGFWA